jgi:hypothetical protein
MNRIQDLDNFYKSLDELARKCGGPFLLSECSGRMRWPVRGVYFFFENGEYRDELRVPRVVRVGTHALKAGSKTTIWNRLSQHKGTGSGGGNHRGSIFRLIVGTAIITKKSFNFPTWGRGSSAPKETRLKETDLEKSVSKVIGEMRFLYLPILDEPGPGSVRGYIERNSIALLSNYQDNGIDLPSSGWLGKHCNREKVQNSGLWNQNHVDESYDPEFLGFMRTLIDEMDCKS